MLTTFKLDPYYGVSVKAAECKGSYLLTPLTRKAKILIKQMDKSNESWWQLQSFHLHRSFRGLGYGKALIGDVISRSIKMRGNVILQAQPYDNPGTTINQLVDWYIEHGFTYVVQPANSHWLVWQHKVANAP